MHFHERELPQYDVAVGSCAMQPFIQLINLDLIQAYFNTNSYSYNKFEPIIANLRRVVGSGIAFSEGNEWKKKRKVISNVFHFEFLHSLIPKMIKTLDEYFEEFDERTEKKVVLLDMFQDLLATFMIKFFFGTELKGQTLDGVAIPLFITKLMFDVNEQGFEPVALALGPKFLELGLRVKDRDINRRVKLFRDYALKTIDDRVKELKEKGFKEGDKKTGDLI
jgi:cytochrome P450